MPARLRSILMATGALLLFVAANAMAESPDSNLEKAVAKANAEWAAAMKTGDAAVIAAPYTDNAVFVLADGRTLQGRAAVEQMYRDGFQKGGTAGSTKIDVQEPGARRRHGVQSGYAEVGVVRQGKPVTRGGRYLTVWQRRRMAHGRSCATSCFPDRLGNAVRVSQPDGRPQRPAAGNCASVLLATESSRSCESAPGLTVPRLSARQSTRTVPGSSTSISRPPSTLVADSTSFPRSPVCCPDDDLRAAVSYRTGPRTAARMHPALSSTVVCVTSRTPTR